MLNNYGEKLMGTILEFKLPAKSKTSSLANDTLISSTVNDVMLIIHHALHGTDKDCQPKDLSLAAKLLDELSYHIKADEMDDFLVLSHVASKTIVGRYPEVIHSGGWES